MTDCHVVLTILRTSNGVLIYLPYQVPSMKPVFVILGPTALYMSLSLFKMSLGATRCGFGATSATFGPGSNSNNGQPVGWLCVTCDVLLREGSN